MITKALRRNLLATTIIAGSLIASPVFAQSAKPADAPKEDDTIVVTGSLIRNPNLVSANPVNVTTSEEIELKQSNLAEEVLREMPGVVPNIGSAVNNGNGGQSFVDLRGLGANRNVVLLDGTRIVPGSLSGSVDLNNIPLALISRVDSLTGAAVTTYGADAITGVVNFITKKNFTGIDLSLGEAINEKGDGNTARADLTVGGNFADGRGNAVLSVGYQKSDPVYQGDRDFSQVQVNSFTGQASGSGTTTPSRFSVPGQGYRQINPATGALQRGYVPFNFNPYNLFQVPFKRYNIYAQANYELADGIEVYTRALFSKNVTNTIVAPSGAFALGVTIPYSNPYIPAGALSQFCAGNGLTVAQCSAAALATNPADPNYKTFNTSLRRRTPEGGTRNSNFESTTFDYQIGLRGHLNSSIDYDVHGSYGESENTQTETGYILSSRIKDALLSTNTATCLSGNPGCVPVNVFGAVGSITPAMLQYLQAAASNTTKTSLAQFHAQVSGGLGFNSPASDKPISFAVGTEYRKYHAEQDADIASQQLGELGGGGAPAVPFSGNYDVWEGFGELIAPLVSDKPGFKDLTLEAGVRYSHYKVYTGGSTNTTTYKAGLTWTPVSMLKLRGNYARAVRAPNIQELFLPVTGGVLTALNVDPCAGANPVGNANLTAVCLAQGAPANQIGFINTPSAGQASAYTGGNLNLQPEKADTYTLGFVLQDPIPHFTLSMDYYHILVRNEIGTPLVGDVVNACFGNTTGSGITAASATNPACTAIKRDPLAGSLDGATTLGLPLVLTNTGRLETSGVDLIANFYHEFGTFKYSAAFVGNYTRSSKFQATPTSLNRECVGYYSGTCSFTGSIQPEYQWSLRNTLTFGKVDLSLLWRHISPVSQEPDDIANGNGPAFIGTTGAGLGALSNRVVNFQHIPAFNYFDLAVRFDVNEHFTMGLSVANLGDKAPPIVGLPIGSTAFDSGNTYPSTYDALGRRFAVSAHIKY